MTVLLPILSVENLARLTTRFANMISSVVAIYERTPEAGEGGAIANWFRGSELRPFLARLDAQRARVKSSYNGAVSPSRTGLMSTTGVPSIASIPSTWMNRPPSTPRTLVR